MKRRCANCKYWVNVGNGFTTSDNNYGSCNSPKFRYQEPNKGETDNVVYSDYEGYSAGLDTGKDFGCIHFEEKK